MGFDRKAKCCDYVYCSFIFYYLKCCLVKMFLVPWVANVYTEDWLGELNTVTL